MNQSDQQLSQGFESSKIIIEEQRNTTSNSFGFRPIDYHPRVLLKSRIFKKLPEQMNQTIHSITYQPINPHSSIRHKKTNQQKRQTTTPQYMYERDNSGYQLVYSKYQSKYIFRYRQQNFTSRQISLKPILRYQQQNYYLLKPFQQQQNCHKSKILRFDSKFQCANLLCSYQVLSNNNQYHLFLENDTNRFGYSQWFCFSLRGMEKDVTYTFKIMNMRKSFSFYKMGMKPCVFSLKKHRKTSNGWEMKGDNVSYSHSLVHDIINNEQSKLYCLEFSLKFDQDDDFITISAGLPYSYSRLITHLKEFKKQAQVNGIQWHQKTIAYTLSNNQVPYLIVKKADKDINQKYLLKNKKKKQDGLNSRPIILIFARQHPGQSNSSYLMQQFLRELAKITKKETLYLLQHYQFHIFPMINVDGVIYGNFRCDLAGFDINRVWRNPLKQIHPQIQAIVSKIRQLSEYQKIICCFDFHSHSKQYNIFSYCCKQQEVQSRVLPFMISKLYEGFSFPNCTFGLSKDKLSTARATIFSIVKHSNVLTIQTSSFARKIGEEIVYLDPKQFAEFSRSILQALKNYVDDSIGVKKDYEGQIKGRINELISYQASYEEQLMGSDSQQEIDPITQVNTLNIHLPENSLKNYQGNLVDVEQANKVILKQINKKQVVQKQSVIIEKVYKLDKKQKTDRVDKCQVQQHQKNIQRFQIKRQQILAIIRTKQSKQTPKKNDNNYHLKVPINNFKANIYKYQQHNKTQTVQDDGIEVSKQQLQLLQTKFVRKNRSSLILKSSSTAQKEAMKLLNNTKIKNYQRPEKAESSMRFKLKSFEENSMASFDKVTNSVGDKRNTDIRRMSRIEKILRIRKRVNTLKNLSQPSQTKNNNNNHLFQLKIGDQQLIKNNPTPSQTTKVKHNKSSTTINNNVNDKMQHLYKGNTKNNKAIIGNHPNAHTSLIGQMWKINYGRYSKDLS